MVVTLKSSRGLVLRAVILFAIGVILATILNVMAIQRRVTILSPEVIANLFAQNWWLPEWWVPASCGLAAVCVGILCPCLDLRLGEPKHFKKEWSSVMRCVAVFVGINHACAKIDFGNNLQFSMTIAAMSVGMWWLFDRSRSGLGLGLGVAVLVSLFTQLIVYADVNRPLHKEIMYSRSWLPCVFFSGGVTVGNIGRQLAVYEEQWKKKHVD
ncbi:insulin-induced gene 2 protein-like [Antedon mediterranea]|uniref:insulin-induced gene 2 protein-like n=1 Tax=Antedon mediterranea TaxID=105859 RepID=UPI003AF77B4D